MPIRLPIALQLVQIRLVLLPGVIAGVLVAQEDEPLVLGPAHHLPCAIGVFGRARAPEAEGPGVARIVQDMQSGGMQQRSKMEFASMRAGMGAVGKEDALVAKIPNGGA